MMNYKDEILMKYNLGWINKTVKAEVVIQQDGFL